MDVHDRTAANRRRLADFFDALDDDQLATPSLCGLWTVRDVLGHLVAPLDYGAGAFVVQLLRAGGSFDKANAAVAQELARRPVAGGRDGTRGPEPEGGRGEAHGDSRSAARGPW